MTAPDYEALYNDLLAQMQAAGLDVSALQKGDERTEYRSADDYIKLLDYFKSKEATASGAAVRTVARNIREIF